MNKNQTQHGGTTMGTKKQKPTKEIRIGRIKAAIWENETENGTRQNVTFSRLYTKDVDGKAVWSSTESFGRDDLLTLEKLTAAVHGELVKPEVKDVE